MFDLLLGPEYREEENEDHSGAKRQREDAEYFKLLSDLHIITRDGTAGMDREM